MVTCTLVNESRVNNISLEHNTFPDDFFTHICHYLATVYRAHEAVLPRHLFLSVMARLAGIGTGNERDLQDLAATVELGIPDGTHYAGLMRASGMSPGVEELISWLGCLKVL